ncbi:MAG: DUF4926 domain-containing protein [Thermomicrobiales bacterium]
MPLPYLGTIRLLTDKYLDEGVTTGAIGTILEVWGDGRYEVEFSNRETGETIAWFTAQEEDLALVAPPGVGRLSRTGD